MGQDGHIYKGRLDEQFPDVQQVDEPLVVGVFFLAAGGLHILVYFLHVQTNKITFYLVLQNQVLSYPILSYLILSYRILFYFILSC